MAQRHRDAILTHVPHWCDQSSVITCMAGHSLKRARLLPGSHRDILPLPAADDSRSIQSIEATLTRVGGTVRQSPFVRTAIEDPSSTWANLQQWEPVDNRQYALDPENGEWYDETLEQEVMDTPRQPPTQAKKKYKRSKVSVRLRPLVLSILN